MGDPVPDSLIRDTTRTLPLYVEFVGVPGSGKSTVRNHLIELLNAADLRTVGQGNLGHAVDSSTGRTLLSGKPWKYCGRVERLAIHSRAHRRRARLALSLYKLGSLGAAAGQLGRDVRSVLLTLFRMDNAHDVVTAGLGDLALFDQGWIHPAREILAATTQDHEDGREIFRMIQATTPPARTLLVLLDVEPEVAASRVHERPRKEGKYWRMARDQTARELEKQVQWCDQMTRWLATHPSVLGVLRLDAQKDPVYLARVTAESILRSLGQQPAVLPFPA
jgi:thymidylate kinase